MSSAVSPDSSLAVKRAGASPSAVPSRAWSTGLAGLAGLFALFLLWWLATAALPDADSLARQFSPLPALSSLAQMLGQAELFWHIAVSLKRVLFGLALALLIGVPLGLLLGLSHKAEATLSPSFQFLRMISPLSWMPIAVMVLGVGDAPVYFLLTFAAVWPIMLNTSAGVRQLDPAWLQLASSLAATRWETLWRVTLPGTVGHILTGTRLAVGIVWIVLVPCEMLGVSAGLGYYILDTRDRMAYSELMALVILIGLLGFLLDYGLRSLCRRWSPSR